MVFGGTILSESGYLETQKISADRRGCVVLSSRPAYVYGMSKQRSWSSKPSGSWKASSREPGRSAGAVASTSERSSRDGIASSNGAKPVVHDSGSGNVPHLYKKRISRDVSLPDGSKIVTLRKDILENALSVMRDKKKD